MTKNDTTEQVKSLSVADFETTFGEKLTPYVIDHIKKYSFQYTEFSSAELDSLLIKIVSTLINPSIQQSGEHRIVEWEAGWGENLELLLRNPSNLELIIPKYFSKYSAVRWRGKFVRPISEKFEYHSLCITQDWLFDKYLRDVSAIYEFGCGTGHNLLRARQVNPTASLFGLDWAIASQRVINCIAASGIDLNIQGRRFDYFEPDYSFALRSGSAIYTVASLEQVGSRWDKFLDYVIQKKPKVCVHIEPIAELLDASNLLDFLSIEYFKKRNYLSGFLIGLRHLEADRKIKIHCAKRTYIGSLFIEGYSVVVWSPI